MDDQIDYSELKAALCSFDKAPFVKCDVNLTVKDDSKINDVTDFKEEETEYYSPNDEDYDDQEHYEPPRTVKKVLDVKLDFSFG